jgi:hypothetical protein
MNAIIVREEHGTDAGVFSAAIEQDLSDCSCFGCDTQPLALIEVRLVP